MDPDQAAHSAQTIPSVVITIGGINQPSKNPFNLCELSSYRMVVANQTTCICRVGEVDLSEMDRFSQTAYTNLMVQVNKRKGAEDKSKKGFILKRLVSRNRNRYQDNRFNLDLSYITNRVIAMGLPG